MFRKRNKCKSDENKRYKSQLVFSTRTDAEHHYNNAVVTNELLYICSKFGVEVSSVEFNEIYITDTVKLICSSVELHMILDELLKSFPLISLKSFRRE